LYIAHQTQNQTAVSNHIKIIHKTHANTAGFIGVINNALFIIFKLIVFRTQIIVGLSHKIYQPKISKQNITKVERINQIVQANLF
jgi:hypothetical protein